MRLHPKTAGGFAAGAFLFLLIFGIGWPGPGTWLLVFALLFLAAAAAAWWLDASALHGARAIAASGVSGGAHPFPPRSAARGRGGARRAGPRRGDSLLLSLGLPGPDAHGRWVLPDTVHITVIAGLTGILALIIFISGALSGDPPQSKPVPTVQPNTALDFSRPVTPALGPTTPTASAASSTTPTTGAQAATAGSATAGTDPIVVDTPSTPRPAPSQPVNAVPVDQTPQNTITHVVVEGDTIYDLAITYNSTIDAIVLANDIGEHDTLSIGETLIIPVP